MSSLAVAGGSSTVPYGNAAQSANNPFETPFDGEDTEESGDDEWWDKDTSGRSSRSRASDRLQMIQQPEPLESNGTGSTMRPAPRVSTHRVEKRYSVQKPKREKSKGRQRKQNAKAGIKVVTTFTRHEEPRPKTQLSTSTTEASRSEPHPGCFVDLAALQALGGASTDVPLAFWKSKKNKDAGKTSKAEAAIVGGYGTSEEPKQVTGPKDSTLSPIKPGDDLSPDDRPIVIGISLSPSRAAEHTTSPQTAASDTSKILQSYQHRTPTNNAPETPAIVITPAQEKSYWSPTTAGTNSAVDRPRATSSIYSAFPFNALGFYTDKDAPPVPTMPNTVMGSERHEAEAEKSCFSPDSDDGTIYGRNSTYTRSRTRADTMTSSDTVFEEDESPVITRRARAVSYSEASRAAKHTSISTVATRRRSKGWWTFITTPFLTRSNTFADRAHQSDQLPTVPNLALAAARAQHASSDDKSWEKQFSPLTPETSTTTSSDAWWNTLTREEQLKGPKASEQDLVVRETRRKVQESSGTLPFVLASAGAIGSPSAAVMDSDSIRSQSDVTNSFTRVQSVAAPNQGSLNLAIPMLSDPPSRRSLHNNNPFVQPNLVDISGMPSRTSSPVRQIAESSRTIGPQVPAQQNPPLSSPPPPPYSPPAAHVPRYRAIFPPEHGMNLEQPFSPGPLSPGLQRAMATGGSIPLSEVPMTPPVRRPINLNSGYTDLPPRNTAAFVTPDLFQKPSKKARKTEARRQRHEREDAVAHRAGGWWRGRGCIPKRGCYSRIGAEGRKRRRCYFGLIVGFTLMLILVIVLATTLHHKSKIIAEQSQWLNLTGFPPIPTGLSTVAAPINIVSNTGCTFPSTVWSCALPKEQQASVAPNQLDQPNFILQIEWDNSSSSNATFANVSGNLNLGARNNAGNPVSAGQFIRNLFLRIRETAAFSPSPSPPNFAEEFFLGNTTDAVAASSKAGEPTPFYISLLSATSASAVDQHLSTRDDSNDTNPFPNVTAFIPAPSLNVDGTAAPANLLPYPVQQPIRLYDRGLLTERYSFYNYFDRSIFLKSLTPLNETNLDNGNVPDDENGGSTESEASERCTWAQTRFLVEIWTRMNTTARLNNAISSSGMVSSTTTTLNFTQPGSFPYPITITLDRHGGNPASKLLYCYGINDREELVASSGQVLAENRGFGGTLINQAPSVFVNRSDPSLGGFDGGTGGCSCQWTNFQKVVHG